MCLIKIQCCFIIMRNNRGSKEWISLVDGVWGSDAFPNKSYNLIL